MKKRKREERIKEKWRREIGRSERAEMEEMEGGVREEGETDREEGRGMRGGRREKRERKRGWRRNGAERYICFN